MPNNVAEPFVKELEDSSKLLIDLSADYRFDKTWTYGLPERKGEREKILGAKLVSNPGCYATGTNVLFLFFITSLSHTTIRIQVHKSL